MAEEANPLGVLTKSLSETVAFAAGFAIHPLLRPLLQELENATWKGTPTKPLDPGTAAQMVAQAVIGEPDGAEEASLTGLAATPFGHLVQTIRTAPDLGTLFNLWRRGYVTEDDFRHGLRKAKLETRWDDALEKLKLDLLDPGQLAAAIHRGLIPDPGLLKGEQPSGPRKVEAYPVYDVDALVEALGSGYNRDRLGVLVGLQGLPMGTHEAALALFRGIITHGDYIAAFNESNSRNEWAEAVLEYSRQIPTARDFFENALRGYHELDWALEQAKRHGMSNADSLVIYQNQGRPMAIRQITQALSRGGVFHPEPGELTDPYDASVVEGNIKPAYYGLAKALRYTLPSPFVMRSLTESGVWSEAKAAKRLKDAGWIPTDADEAAHAWANATGGASSSHVKKAQTQLWTTAHRSYLTGELTDADASAALEAAGVSAAEVPQVLILWAHEANITRKRLTQAQIKSAYKKSAVNAGTGQPWTRDEAIAALGALGLPPLQAQDYLNI